MKIAIAHFRAGLTDGVSLEMDKRTQILTQLGHQVSTIAGSHSGMVDLHIRYFEYKHHPKIIEVNDLAFKEDKEAELQTLVEEIAAKVEHDLEEFWAKDQFEVLFMHNLFCLPTCLPGSLAFYRFLKNHPSIQGITIHHDFYWEAPRVHMFAFSNPYAQELLKEVFPPNLPNLKHTVINSLAQKALKEKRGIDSEIITDTFDFDQALWGPTDENAEYMHDVGISPEDLVFLIAVRVRERKAVELAIDVVDHVTRIKKQFVGKKKWNGEVITENSKVVLVIPGEFTEKEQKYVLKLQEKAMEHNVEIRWIQTLVGSELEKEKQLKKYALWDCYVYSDAVLYTSHWEGWGNQFIEAVFAKKPVVVFEYPVFTSDIKNDGFDVVSLGNEYTLTENDLAQVSDEKLEQGAQEIMEIITDPQKYTAIIENNFSVGHAKYNIHTRLKDHLQRMISVSKTS